MAESQLLTEHTACFPGTFYDSFRQEQEVKYWKKQEVTRTVVHFVADISGTYSIVLITFSQLAEMQS